MWFQEVLKKNGRIIGLSPMADMTDSAFCRIVRRLGGADIVFREMVRSEALVRRNTRTLNMIRFLPEERPIVQQIFGSDPVTMARAAETVMEMAAPDGIDINMGCPMYKLTNNSNGCALMNEPERAAAIVREVKRAIGRTPLSVKIRLGWSDPDQFKDFIPVMEEAGVDLITVHGRTKAQGFSGASDWMRIAEAKRIATVPLLANGDINSPHHVHQVLGVTKAEGVLIARGALGNPWFFKQANFARRFTDRPEVPSPSLEERIKIVLDHAALHLELYGPGAIRTFRKHLAAYFRESKTGFEMSGIREFRARLVRVGTLEELSSILWSLRESCPRSFGERLR